MNKRAAGTEYENRAAEYLKNQNYEILQQNFRCRLGEIDIIARDRAEQSIVFLEVKYRKNRRSGLPEEAVSFSKQRTICRVAAYYLTRYQISADIPMRFDVIAFQGTAVRHYRNAFPYCAR